ncbi:MAG: arylamine N-acetyltransferase, partial [Vicinamibacteria bacterium]
LYPLRLEPHEVHEETEYHYRLTWRDPHWHLERASHDGDDYGVQYRFTTAPRLLADFRGGSEYHQTSPESTFTQKVVVTRALEDGRVTVTRDRVMLRQGNHQSETPLADERAWRDALARHFGIHLETV